MEKFIYNIWVKLWMNDVESQLLDLTDVKNKIIFDVGAFRGVFTDNIMKQENIKENISNYYLFDPNPNAKYYLEDILKNKNVKYSELALDNSNTKKEFTINRFFEASGSSLKSAHKDDKLYNVTRKSILKLLNPFKKIKDYETITVQTQTMDNFCSINNIDRIDILKLDCDGTEYEVLLGAEKLLSEDRIGLIYTEISGVKKGFDSKVDEIVKLLNKYNFQLKKTWNFPHFSFLSNLKATDNLFIKKN
jgi:FkbM family methyltransferase